MKTRPAAHSRARAPIQPRPHTRSPRVRGWLRAHPQDPEPGPGQRPAASACQRPPATRDRGSGGASLGTPAEQSPGPVLHSGSSTFPDSCVLSKAAGLISTQTLVWADGAHGPRGQRWDPILSGPSAPPSPRGRAGDAPSRRSPPRADAGQQCGASQVTTWDTEQGTRSIPEKLKASHV